MIAVTIGVGEKHELLARLSARTCEKHAGLKAFILGVHEMARHRVKKPHHLKFRLFQEFPEAEAILYFDADTIFLRAFDPSPFQNVPELVCVRDVWERNWIREDAERLGIAAKDYFNSGMFIVNRTHHQPMLETAEGLVGKVISQYNDQSVLNAARAQLGIPLRLLDKAFNFIAFENCREPQSVTIGHMNGMGHRPINSIKRYYQFWMRREFPKSAKAERTAAEIVGRWFEYHRVGYDCRAMQFEADGNIGKGRGGSEQQWDVTEEEGEAVLWIIGREQPTCALVRDETSGIWQGRWMRSEQMPTLLTPHPA